MFTRREQGAQGEKQARAYLKRAGAKVVAQNYACKAGEIDLIIMDQGVLAFVEVKQRTSAEHGRPAEAVDRKKQRRVAKAAMRYVQEKRLEGQRMRFDVVEVEPTGIRWIKGAYDIYDSRLT